MDHIWHIVNSVILVRNAEAKKTKQNKKTKHFQCPAAENNQNTAHCTFRRLIRLLINSNDSTIDSPRSFQNSILTYILYSEQKCLSTSATFKNSVEGNCATSDWLQKTFCSEANKESHGPSSSSKDLIFFPVFRVPASSSKKTD